MSLCLWLGTFFVCGIPAQLSRRDPLPQGGGRRGVLLGPFTLVKGDTTTWEIEAPRRRPDEVRLRSPSCSWRAANAMIEVCGNLYHPARVVCI